MKKLFFLFLLLFSLSSVEAQTVYGIQMDSLKLLVEEEPAMYHEIAANFHSPDTSQDFVDLIILYYGSAYRANYGPYGEKSITNAIWELIEKEKYTEALQSAEAFLTDEPANTTALRQKGFIFLEQNDTVNAELYFRKYYELLSVAYNSGDGKSAKSAFLVRSVDDEYAIVRLMDGDVQEQSLVNEKGSTFDVLKISLEDGSKQTLWFNIDLPFKIGMAKMFNFSDLEEKDTKSKKSKRSKKSKSRKKRD